MNIHFKRIEKGYYVCKEFPNYSIKKLNNRLWMGYDSKKETGNHICCNDITLKKVKEIIIDYIINGCWYKK